MLRPSSVTVATVQVGKIEFLLSAFQRTKQRNAFSISGKICANAVCFESRTRLTLGPACFGFMRSESNPFQGPCCYDLIAYNVSLEAPQPKEPNRDTSMSIVLADHEIRPGEVGFGPFQALHSTDFLAEK